MALPGWLLRTGSITIDYPVISAHYGVVPDPAQVRDLYRKGTVEHAIKHTQDSALKGRSFASIEEQTTFLEHGETNWVASRRYFPQSCTT